MLSRPALCCAATLAVSAVAIPYVLWLAPASGPAPTGTLGDPSPPVIGPHVPSPQALEQRLDDSSMAPSARETPPESSNPTDAQDLPASDGGSR